MRIVVDTNVIASAIFFGGKPKQVVDLVVGGSLDAYASNEILTEYDETVKELSMRFSCRQAELSLDIISKSMHVVEPSTSVSVCRDPDDDMFIECAIEAECVYIVSGDKDLLSIEEYEGIQIMTVADFLQQIEK